MDLWKITARQLPTEYQTSGRNYWYSRSIWDWRWALQPDCVFTASRAIPFIYGLCNRTLALLSQCNVWQNQVALRPRPLLQRKCIPQQFISFWRPTISFHLCNILPSVASTEDSARTSALLRRTTHTLGYSLQASPVVPVIFRVLPGTYPSQRQLMGTDCDFPDKGSAVPCTVAGALPHLYWKYLA